MFVSGTMEGLMNIKRRKHNAEDIKSTVLAVDPIKFVHRGRYVDNVHTYIFYSRVAFDMVPSNSLYLLFSVNMANFEAAEF